MAHVTRRASVNAATAVRDFAFGLLLFWGVTFALCASHAPANAFTFPTAPAYETGPVQLLKVEKAGYYATVAHGALVQLNPTRAAITPTLAMMGFVFALLTMMNLAFVRHVRRAYSRPARRARKS